MIYAQQRLAAIEPFHVVELLTRAKELEAAGRDIIHMEVGEPDFATPPQIAEAAIQAIRSGHVGYTPPLGIPALRKAISDFYRRRHGLDIPASRIIVTSGASGGLALACACLVEPGSRWLLTDPGYPCNQNFVRTFEGEPVAIQTTSDSGFQPTASQVDDAWCARTGGALLASPSNPTGTLMAPAVMGEIFERVCARDGTLIVDEIYQGLTYECDVTTALSLSENARENIWIVQSFSKFFQMTGWRLGWLVVPERHLRDIEKLAQNLFIAPSHPAQYGALAGFQDETLALLETRRQTLRRRRDALLPALRNLGFSVPAVPQGAFYVYADASQVTNDSHQFCRDLLEMTGVAITPGIDFTRNQPERYVRFAYTTGEKRILEAIDRIAAFLK